MTAPNVYTTNQPQSSFLQQTQGYVQGLPQDDTVSRMWLVEGNLVSNASQVVWGGTPLTEQINVTGSGSEGLGPVVATATAQGNCTAFSTFYQMMHGVITPQASVPVYGPTNGVGFFRLGTNTRLAVACDPALITAITGVGAAINSQALYWDVTNYRITLVTSGGNWALPTSIKLLAVNSNSKIVTFANSTANWSAGSAAIILL